MSSAQALLLDFDGPVCSVFAGVPASAVAEQLRQVLYDSGHTELPTSIKSATDPFDVLYYANELGDVEARCVEAAFTAHEIEAVQSAMPTGGAHDLIRRWRASGRPIAIVSNNSVKAIEVYLRLYDLYALINVVSARTGPNTSLLKPSPHLLRLAIESLEVVPESCVFIGDSVSDIEAAAASDVVSIGYANKPGKRAKLTAADVVIDTLAGVNSV